MQQEINLIVILGPTASGKTHLGVQVADKLNGEIISADSRQVYRGLNIGAGKDLGEYELPGKKIAHHLIDCADINREFSVFHFQQSFYAAFRDCCQRQVWPVLVGGTGMYLEAVLLKYAMSPVPENAGLRAEIATNSQAELMARLSRIKTMHNTTDLATRERLVRAVEIAEYEKSHAPEPRPEIHPLVLGLRWERSRLRERIAQRLQERLEQGLLEEIEQLHRQGVSWDRLQELGLEYRYGAEYLQKKWRTRSKMAAALNIAIGQFAKRQDTWFRRMERRGIAIHWLEENYWETAWQYLQPKLPSQPGPC